MRYKHIGEVEVLAPTIHKVLQPGDEFESERELNNRNFVLVEEPKKKQQKGSDG